MVIKRRKSLRKQLILIIGILIALELFIGGNLISKPIGNTNNDLTNTILKSDVDFKNSDGLTDIHN